MSTSIKFKNNMYLSTKGIAHDKSILYNVLSPLIKYTQNTEIAVGTWIDGKTIYRKVITKTFSAQNSNWQVAGTIPNFNALIDFRCIVNYTWGTYQSMAYNGNNDSATLYVDDSGNIQVIVGSSTGTYYIIVEYTKK